MRHLLINFHVQPSLFAHISTSSVLLCVKTGSMNGFIADSAGMCFGFILLANQEMLYWQANQKR